jgi:uncharacterized phiE125 gp8 family phage protein
MYNFVPWATDDRHGSYDLYLKTPPTIEPISLTEIKQTLGMSDIGEECVNFTADDEYLTALITAAREYCEIYRSEAFLTQQFEMTMQCFPCVIYFPRKNIQTVSTITYKDSDGVTKSLTVNTDFVYSKRGEKPRILPASGKTFPSFTPFPVDAITITFTAGYESPSDVPERIKQAIKLLVSHWYENRTPIDATRTEPKEIAFMLTSLLNIDRGRKI